MFTNLFLSLDLSPCVYLTFGLHLPLTLSLPFHTLAFGLGTDIIELCTDITGLCTDITGLCTDITGLCTDITGLCTDILHAR